MQYTLEGEHGRGSSSKTSSCAHVGGRKPPGQQKDLDTEVAFQIQQRHKFATWHTMTHAGHCRTRSS